MKEASPRHRLVRAAAAAAILLVCATAWPQAARVDPGKNDDLRAAFASAADIAEGKRIADTTCASCHGMNGVSTVEGTPSLAAQRPGYLYAELRAYQAGARPATVMSNVARPLSDAAMVKVAAFFASLEPPSPPASPAKPQPAKPDALEAGKAAAAACAGCHGDGGVTKIPGTPSLAGLDPKYIVAATGAYKNGQRKSEVMKPMASAVSDADLANVALYFALQKPARAPTPAAGDQAAGKAAAAACAGCHGETGVSAVAANPSLAGQDGEYLVAALRGYKDGSRADDTMKGLSAGLDDAAMKNVAAWFASQQPRAPAVRKPLSTADWVQRCDRCHGMNGNSTDPRLPALAAQRQDYLERVLHAYQKGERKSPQMAAMSEGLTDADVVSLAAYYARQKPRGVVYVALPPK